MRYLFSLPERILRALAALLGGFLYELTEVALPTWVRKSQLYQTIVARLLRITMELIGDVQGVLPEESMDVVELATRKTAGNVIEVASFLAVGWSPLWLLAAAADLTGGTQTYLVELVSELHRQNLLPEDSKFASVDELLTALENTSGTMADLVDIPPLNVEDMRKSWHRLKENASELPSSNRLARLYSELEQVARQEGQTIGSVSGIIATSTMRAGLQMGNTYIFDYYRRAILNIQEEGLAVYTTRVIQPYLMAAVTHFDPRRDTGTEKIISRFSRPKNLESGNKKTLE